MKKEHGTLLLVAAGIITAIILSSKSAAASPRPTPTRPVGPTATTKPSGEAALRD